MRQARFINPQIVMSLNHLSASYMLPLSVWNPSPVADAVEESDYCEGSWRYAMVSFRPAFANNSEAVTCIPHS